VSEDDTPEIDVAPLAAGDRNETIIERRRACRSTARRHIEEALKGGEGKLTRTPWGWEFVFNGAL
jgi:hypothetical protein